MTATRLDAPDAYYYDAKKPPELPVLRFAFDDPVATHVYISPRTGAIVAADDRVRRQYRWLYQGLHTWDLNLLTDHRPAWDVAVIAGLVPGLILSVAAVVIGWRRLRRPARPVRAA